MRNKIKLTQKDIEKVVTNVLKEQMDIKEMAVETDNPEIQDKVGADYVTVEPKGDVVNPMGDGGLTFVKNERGVIYAIDNRTGEIKHKF